MPTFFIKRLSAAVRLLLLFVLIKQPVFDPLLALFQNQEALVDSLLRLDKKNDELDVTQQQKIKQLEQLVTLQKEHTVVDVHMLHL